MKINKQTNKNKAKLKFYERIKVFLSKKCENTSSSYHSMGTDVLWTDVFFSRLDVQETFYKCPSDVGAHWARAFLIFSDYRTSFL